jgi:nitrogen regulatory protein PII
MKAVLIVHNVAIERDVNEVLDAVGISSFTKFTNVLGKGRLSEPHLNTDVWPGTNFCTLVVTDQPTAEKLMAAVRRLRERLGTEGLKGFTWQIDDIT